MTPKWIHDFIIGLMSLFGAFIMIIAAVLLFNGIFSIVSVEPSKIQDQYIVYFSVLIVFFAQYYLLRRYCNNKVVNFLFSGITLAIAIWVLIQY